MSHLFRLAICSILIPLTVCRSFRPDQFTENLLSNFTPPGLSTTAQSAHQLPDSTILIAARLHVPLNHTAPASFISLPSLAAPVSTPAKARTSGLLLRLTTNATLLWARQTAPCTPSTTFSLTVFNATIYLAAASTAFKTAPSDPPVPLLLSFSQNGTLLNSNTFAPPSVTLHAITSVSDNLLVVASARADHPVFENNRPTISALFVSRIHPIRLETIASRSLVASASVTRDMFWNFKTSPSANFLYVLAKRQAIVNNSPTSTLQVMRINPTNFKTISTSFKTKLQKTSILAISKTHLFITYVSRIKSKERIELHTLSHDLKPVPNRPLRRFHIGQDDTYTRATRANAVDAVVLTTDHVAVLLHTAEIIDKNDPNFKRNRALSNARPAFLVLSTAGNMQFIRQFTGNQLWQPHILINSNPWIIVGNDMGLPNSKLERAPRLLFTQLRRPETFIPSPAPSRSPMPQPASPIFVSAPDNNERGCIGKSSVFDKRPVLHVIRDDPRVRRQWHILQTPSPVSMLCYTWHNGRLCATKTHIVRLQGRLMYMHTFCQHVTCEISMDVPVNFKAPCGVDIRVKDTLMVTMHVGSVGISPDTAVRRECQLRTFAWAAWLLVSL